MSPAATRALPRATRALLGLLCLGVAGYAVLAYSLLPAGALVHPQMAASFAAHPLVLYLHVFGSACALVLGPLQLSAGLRAARPGLHRACGRLYLLAGVGVGGLAGLWLAGHAWGGAVSQWGFGLLACAWLASGAVALRAVLRRDVAAHRRWMVRNFALTAAAVTLRLLLPAALAAGLPFELAYPAIAWLCWVPNLLAAELWLARTRRPAAAMPH